MGAHDRVCGTCKQEIPRDQPSWMDVFGSYTCKRCLDQKQITAEALLAENKMLRQKNQEYLEVMARQAKELERLGWLIVKGKEVTP